MTPLESSVGDSTVWNVSLGSSIMILEASFSFIYDVFSTGITYEHYQWMIIKSL